MKDWQMALPDDKNARKPETVEVWPHLVFKELIAMLLLTAALTIVSLYVEAPLEEMADPSYTPRVAKAPWYFVGLQELLVYFDPWIAGVMVPGLIIIGLMAIPYVDHSREDVGQFAPSKRPLAWSFFSFGLALWFILIAIGQYARGPHWAWFWPGQSWDVDPPAAAPSVDLLPVAGIAAAVAYFALGIGLPAILFPGFRRKLGTTRYLAAMGFLLLTLAIPAKIVLRLVFDVHYVLTTPWFNI